MAYATGTPASCVAVLQALATFCTSYGWTVDYSNTYTGYAWYLAVHKGTCYLNFAVPTGDGKVSVYGATGYSSSNGPTNQANSSPVSQCNPGQTASGLNPGPYAAYHFFSSTSGTYLHCIIEISAGVFAHFHAGQLNVVGGAAPAIYLASSNWYRYAPTSTSDPVASSPDSSGNNIKPFTADPANSNYTGRGLLFGCTVDGTLRWFNQNGAATPSRLNAMGNSGIDNSGWARRGHTRSPNTFNGLTVLIPIPIFVERAAGNIYSCAGECPDVRYFNMTNNNAKDEITISSDVWKVFPIIANSLPINTNNAPASSYPYGLAFKKSA